MNKFLFLLWVLILSAFIFFLDHGFAVGERQLPGFGKLLNPFSGIWSTPDGGTLPRDLKVDGVEGPVRVYFDDRGVPHIYASSLRDALFAQGYVEARDRLWQMDFIARNAAGRLSEVIGERGLNSDVYKRKLGMNIGAQKAVEGWKKFPEQYNLLESYIKGINAYIDGLGKKDYPLEFKLLDYKPEAWTDYHSALVFKSMSLTLAGGAKDLGNHNAFQHFGQKEFNVLFPEQNARQKPIIPGSVKYDFEPVKREPPVDSMYPGPVLRQMKLRPQPEGVGSNNWAVAGSRTKSGYPILANDPHLSLTLPSIWYEVHVVTPEFNAYGVTIPGVPGIPIGFNEHIAWGNTNVGHDVLDLIAIEWTDDDRTAYTVDGKNQTAKIRNEEIIVRRGDNVILPIRETVFGQVYLESEIREQPDLAIQWLATLPPDKPELTVFVETMRAGNYEQFKEVTANFIAPAQNFLFASMDGTIALRVNGDLPLKYDQEGRFVKSGSSLKNTWNTYIPRAHNPQIENPSSGYVGSANQHSAAPDYPYYYNGRFEDFRGRRVYDLLDNYDDVDFSTMQSMQLDNKSLKAVDVLPYLLENVDQDELSAKGREFFSILNDWDHNYDKDAKGATLFDEWFKRLEKRYWDEFSLLKDSFSMELPEDFRLVELLQDSTHAYADILATPAKETNREIINLSFKDLVGTFSESDRDMEWHKFRNVRIPHYLAIPAFSHANLPVGGHQDVLNATRGSFGPSWRMIVEFGPRIKAHGVFPGGQSGHPGSLHFDDSIETWVNGTYHDIDIYLEPGDFESRGRKAFQIQPKN